MSVMQWEPEAVKAQLRLTCLRLGQLQEKKDSQAVIIRRDIATLLQQRNTGLARTKAQKLVQDDVMGDLVEILEMHVGIILEHFSEIDRNISPSPNVLEAASSIIYAAPQVGLKDLNNVRNLLVQRLGLDFSRSASGNHDNHVSSRVIQIVSTPPPTAAALDAYLEDTARMFNVEWSPEPRRHDIVSSISEILDPDASPVVDMARLRKLCSHGIPDEPTWLRPRIWKLFFGILPVLKKSWKTEVRKQRENYYDLIRRLLDPFSKLPPPSTPLSSPDATLLRVSEQLLSISPIMLAPLDKEPDRLECPLDGASDTRIPSALNLDLRLEVLQGAGGGRTQTREKPLDFNTIHTPEISLSSPDSEPNEGQIRTTLLPSTGGIHHHHSTALLRLLYLHASINPGSHSPHIPSLLVPIYVVLNQEVEAGDLAHVEADTFWLFEAMVGEFSELEDDQEGSVWMKKFSQRTSWADGDLLNNLQTKGLDPALPHYSYRWLAPLLTQTLPLDAVYLVWDALFSCQTRNRDENPKLDHLLDICTAMLIHARVALLKLGKGDQRPPSLWDDETNVMPPRSPLHTWELGNAFVEGISLLQKYPLKNAGGIDRILQTASDLRYRREEEAKSGKVEKVGLGARLKVTIWKGFTNQVSSPIPSPVGSDEFNNETHDDGNETETETQTQAERSGLTSRLANTVWKGITNQTSMEVPPSPTWPRSRTSSRSPSPIPTPSPSSSSQEPLDTEVKGSRHTVTQSSSSLWSYAEKLKDSDTAATIAKVSSNWRARALISSWGLSTSPQQHAAIDTPPKHSRPESLDQAYRNHSKDLRHGSLPPPDRSEIYSPPPRPLFFRPPRDSVIFPHDATLSPTSSEHIPPVDNTFMKRTKNLQSSLASLTRTQSAQPTTKAAPRPLLLGSGSSIASPPSLSISQTKSAPVPDRGEWANVLKLKQHNFHRDSQSSISSLSPSDALERPYKSGWDSDNGVSSRFVPLNRRSVSPMAPGFRIHQNRPTSGSSSAASSDRNSINRSLGDIPLSNHARRGDSSPLASPSHPQTPSVDLSHDDNVRVIEAEHPSPMLMHPKKSIRKKTPPSSLVDETSDSSVVEIPTRSPRLRSKRYPNRPPNLDVQNTPTRSPNIERKLSNPNSLIVEWPNDDQDIIITPRASTFNDDELSRIPRSPRRSRKISTETMERFSRKSSADQDTRLRKNSTNQRTRKISGDKGIDKKAGESSADEGDDEGYDELLSAYESEEGLSLR